LTVGKKKENKGTAKGNNLKRSRGRRDKVVLP